MLFVLSIKNTFICYIVLWVRTNARETHSSLDLKLTAGSSHGHMVLLDVAVLMGVCVWVLLALKCLHALCLQRAYLTTLVTCFLMLAFNF